MMTVIHIPHQLWSDLHRKRVNHLYDNKLIIKSTLQESQSLVDIVTHPLLAATSSVDRLKQLIWIITTILLLLLIIIIVAIISIIIIVIIIIDILIILIITAIGAAVEAEAVNDFFQKSRDKSTTLFCMRRGQGADSCDDQDKDVGLNGF